jgi:hypothetical protein
MNTLAMAVRPFGPVPAAIGYERFIQIVVVP